MNKVRRSQRGITLFEVLVATLILSVGIMSALQALRHSLVITKRSHEYFEARFIMADALFHLYAAQTEEDYQAAIGTQGKPPEGMTVTGVYTWKHEGETVELPQSSEETVAVEESPYVYKRTETSLTHDGNVVFTIPSFQEVMAAEH